MQQLRRDLARWHLTDVALAVGDCWIIAAAKVRHGFFTVTFGKSNAGHAMYTSG